MSYCDCVHVTNGIGRRSVIVAETFCVLTSVLGLPPEKVTEALKVVLEEQNQPLLVHCNRGKHRTGTVIACMRRLERWHCSWALDEYRRFSHPKERETDMKFISAFEVEDIWPCIECKYRYVIDPVEALMSSLSPIVA